MEKNWFCGLWWESDYYFDVNVLMLCDVIL